MIDNNLHLDCEPRNDHHEVKSHFPESLTWIALVLITVLLTWRLLSQYSIFIFLHIWLFLSRSYRSSVCVCVLSCSRLLLRSAGWAQCVFVYWATHIWGTELICFQFQPIIIWLSLRIDCCSCPSGRCRPPQKNSASSLIIFTGEIWCRCCGLTKSAENEFRDGVSRKPEHKTRL